MAEQLNNNGLHLPLLPLLCPSGLPAHCKIQLDPVSEAANSSLGRDPTPTIDKKLPFLSKILCLYLNPINIILEGNKNRLLIFLFTEQFCLSPINHPATLPVLT